MRVARFVCFSVQEGIKHVKTKNRRILACERAVASKSKVNFFYPLSYPLYPLFYPLLDNT